MHASLIRSVEAGEWNANQGRQVPRGANDVNETTSSGVTVLLLSLLPQASGSAFWESAAMFSRAASTACLMAKNTEAAKNKGGSPICNGLINLKI